MNGSLRTVSDIKRRNSSARLIGTIFGMASQPLGERFALGGYLYRIFNSTLFFIFKAFFQFVTFLR